MTSGTSGVHVCPNPCTLNDIILEVDSPFNPANVGSIQSSGGQGDLLTYTYKVTNTGGAQLANVKVLDDNGTPGVLTDDFFAAAVKNANGNNYGDVNNNGLLDPNEIWYFQAKDYACHDFTNTATVTADVVPLVGVVQDTASASFHLVA